MKENSPLKSKKKENVGEVFSIGKLLTQAKMLVTETRFIHRHRHQAVSEERERKKQSM